jgi:hypothetical protein
MLVEDIHLAAPLRDIVVTLPDQLDRAFGKNPARRLCFTTRERISPDDRFYLAEATVIELAPLTQRETQNFFLRLCQLNGAPHHVAAIGAALAEAFSVENTCTPLFAVVCAWLATVSAKGSHDVAKLLAMKSSQLLEALLRELLRRAPGLSGWPLSDFVRAYGSLAATLWPTWNDIDADKAGEILSSGVADNGQVSLSIDALVRNGFLSRQEGAFGPDTVSFPHQSMADLLLVSELIRTGDLSRLESHAGSQRLEGLSDFFADLTENSEVMLRLAAVDRVLFCRSFVDWLRRTDLSSGDREDLLRRSAEVIAAWFWRRRNGNVHVSTWLTVRSSLAERFAPWRAHFCRQIEDLAPQPGDVRALLVLSGEPCRDLLARWLVSDDRAFAAVSDDLRLIELLREWSQDQGWNTPVGWAAFRLLWEKAPAAERDRLRRTIPDLSARVTNERVGAIIATDLKRLARFLEFAPVEQRRRVGVIVAREKGQTLIPPGEYKLDVNGTERTVHVRSPLLVNCAPTSLKGTYTVEEARAAAEKGVPARAIMTEWQGRIAFQYFADLRPNASAPYLGIVFGAADAARPVVWRTKGQGESSPKVGLFFGVGLRAAAPKDDRWQKTVRITSIAWHEVEAL